MHEAMFYEKKGKDVQCHLCPHNCLIKPGKRGICKVRENQDGKLYSLVYGKVVAVSADPIEKKPLFHFLPGTDVFSIGTLGCNLGCKHCQNWQTASVGPGEYPEEELPVEEAVNMAIEQGCKSVACTYNEPTIYYEYMLDIFKLAKKKGLKTVAVTNGYMNLEPAKKLSPYIDALNIDLKAFDDDFYKKITGARLQPVLDSIKFWCKEKRWVEITNLIIPTLNDDMKKIEEMCKWIKKEVGVDVPLHFSAFYPCFKLQNLPSTPVITLEKAYDVAKKVGLKHVYVGNVPDTEKENTVCDGCGKQIIVRKGFHITALDVEKGKCKNCGKKLKGIFV